jgi:hypothetical protein
MRSLKSDARPTRGGYARELDDTVTIHCNTVLAAKEGFAGRAAKQG